MKYLKECASNYSIELSDNQLEQFQIYYDMLIEKNKVMNLTAITEKKEVIIKHFLDSIAILNDISLSNETVLDIGTGAGFPGIPLKIVRPDCSITLLDSLNKRVDFLNDVINVLELNNIKAVHGRAEDFARQKEYREQYDYVVSRAVANLATLSEYCLPFVKLGGYFISYKSGQVEEELEKGKSAIFLCGGKKEAVNYFTLPDSEDHRSFVHIKKVKGTPKLYPRKAGTPAKKPL